MFVHPAVNFPQVSVGNSLKLPMETWGKLGRRHEPSQTIMVPEPNPFKNNF